jgi:hypothetical protein
MCLFCVSSQFREKQVGFLTRIPLPIKVVLWIAVTFQFQSLLLCGWAVGEWYVIIRDVVKELDFIFVQQETGSNRVYRSITPALVEESAILVKGFEKVNIGFGPEPIKVSDLEVGPLDVDISKSGLDGIFASTYHMAMIVGLSTIVTQETHRVVLGNMLGVSLHELFGTVPQSRNRFHVFVQTQHEAVLLLIIGHKFEDIVIHITEKLDAWLHSPVPIIVEHQWLTEEESRFKSAHMAIAD